MAVKQDTALATQAFSRDPFELLRQMTAEFDRAFGAAGWPGFGWPALQTAKGEGAAWAPTIDVVQKEEQLVTRVDLPGLKKEDVKVEVTDGHLAISGERKRESEETTDRVFRREREHGIFYRAVPLPDGVTLDDVKATFADGVLEVRVPLPTKTAPTSRTIEIQ